MKDFHKSSLQLHVNTFRNTQRKHTIKQTFNTQNFSYEKKVKPKNSLLKNKVTASLIQFFNVWNRSKKNTYRKMPGGKNALEKVLSRHYNGPKASNTKQFY